MELKNGGMLSYNEEKLHTIVFMTQSEDRIFMMLTSKSNNSSVTSLTLHEAVKLRNELQTEIDKLTNEA